MRTDSREAKLKENCELPGTDKFSRKTKALLFIILQMFCNGSEKIFTNSFLFSAWDVSSDSLRYDFINKQIFPSSVTAIKLSLLLN